MQKSSKYLRASLLCNDLALLLCSFLSSPSSSSPVINLLQMLICLDLSYFQTLYVYLSHRKNYPDIFFPSFQLISNPSFDSIEPGDWLTFRPVKSFPPIMHTCCVCVDHPFYFYAFFIDTFLFMLHTFVSVSVFSVIFFIFTWVYYPVCLSRNLSYLPTLFRIHIE